MTPSNVGNNVVTAIPITPNTVDVYSFEVFIPKGIANLPKDSKVKTDQIRALDKIRFVKSIGQLPTSYIDLIEEAMKLHLVLK